jgi:hypothetical protein
MSELKKLTNEEWRDEARKRYPSSIDDIRFRCPSCDNVMSVKDYKDAGADPGEIGVNCIGRSQGSKVTIGTRGKGPCNYAGFGLFKLNPIEVTGDDGVTRVMDFADDPLVKGED